MSQQSMVRTIAVAALVGANLALAAALARPAEASAAFGCALGPEKCACIVSTEVCSSIPPLSEFPCHFQQVCADSY
jgi:hypothetical protein